MKLKRYMIYLGISILLLFLGIIAIINGSPILSSLILGILFLCISYSSYRFSIKEKSTIGKDLTIFTFVLFIIFLILGDGYYSGSFLFLSIVFLIFWYLENRKNKKIK